MPPNEIVKYIRFSDGLPYPKEGMPDKYMASFQKYQKEYQEAKDMRKKTFDDIESALSDSNHS